MFGLPSCHVISSTPSPLTLTCAFGSKAKIAELKTIYDSFQYQRDRAKEYPSIEDQLDDLYHNGIDGWKTTIKAVKDKYPKE